jgi:hypothetical protein
MSSSLKSIITNLVTHVVIFTGTPGRDMPKLVNQDAILLRAAKAQFLPPDNYLAPDSTNYARFNATTNWALSLEYAFSFQITNASLVGFPLSLPDLGFKKGVLVLRNFPMSMFSRVTCTNLVFNFGHSIVPVSGGAPWTREDSPGFDWHFVTTQFGRHPLPVLSFDIPVMSFQFPDEDTLFRRNQKN